MNLKRIGVPGAIVAAVFLGAGGGSVVSSMASNAAITTSPSTTATNDSTTNDDHGHTMDRSRGGHQANGVTETVLTGDDATKATAAAKAAVSGGTVDRVETDAEGAKYEAHMTKADGTRVTVKMDANFNVTSVEDGMR